MKVEELKDTIYEEYMCGECLKHECIIRTLPGKKEDFGHPLRCPYGIREIGKTTDLCVWESYTYVRQNK